MPDPPTIERLRSLILSATELRKMHPEWSGAMVEDYLNIFENLVTIAGLLDIEIDQKLEEVSTDFLDGSIPFVEDGFLVEDNVNLFFSNLTKTLFANNVSSNYIDFVTSPDVPSGDQEGRTYWNDSDKTLNIDTGLGPILQANQETVILAYNNTGSQLDNGTVVQPIAGATDARPHISKAKADTHETLSRDIWVATMDIPDQTTGIVTKFGKVRGLDTSAFTEGDNIWVSATVAGEYVNVIPEFPNYAIQVGGVAVSDATEGEIVVDVEGRAIDTTLNFWNGVFRETFAFMVSSDGVTITGSIEPENGHPDMTMMFSDGLSTFDTSPPATIALTEGTDDIPQTNYVYILQSNKILAVSTSDWPGPQHIKVAEIVLQTASTVETDGALRNQNWNDHIEDTTTFQGHLSHITEKIRQFEAQWDSGVEGSSVIDSTPTPDNVIVKNTSGVVYQMHKQSFPILDMTQYTIDAVSQGSKTFTISGDGDLTSTFTDDRLISVHNSTGNDGLYTIASTSYSAPDFVITVEESIPDATVDGTIGDDIHIVNDSVSPYKAVIDLNGETLDANGDALSNRSFSFVVWGVQNKSGQAQHLMLNLPGGSYTRLNPDSAVQDADNFSVYSIPKQFQGVGFLIARFTYQLDATGNVWTLYDTEDLRGKVPNSTAGGGAGGSGVTTFTGLTDTPSSYVAQSEKLVRVASGETALEFVAPTTAILTDYEEGVYTATMTPATSGTVTLNSAVDTLSYTKIGRVVHVIGSINVDSISSPVGDIRINLPFPVVNLTDQAGRSSGSVSTNLSNFTGDYLTCHITEGLSYFVILENTTGVAWDIYNGSDISANDTFVFQMTYFTA